MTRVSDLSQSQLLITELNRANAQLNKTQLQISSGKKAQYFKDLAEQAGVLLSAKRVLDRNGHYTETTTELGQKLAQQNLGLGQIERAAGDLRQNVLDAIASDSGLAFMDNINAVFQSALGALNTKIDGQYIFGGTRTDVAPVNATSLDDLFFFSTPSLPRPMTGLGGIFDNNDVKASATVDEGVKIEYGMTASDLGTQLMSVLQAIKQFNETNPDGPIAGPLTAGQRAFLDGQVVGLKSIAEGITSFVAQNGVTQNRVDQVAIHLSDIKIATAQFVSEIEDADLPSALTQLQQNQVAVEAAARMAAQLGQLSLLNFLPTL
jgi:flagellar hook-associated protein 3 FlgL